MLDVLPHQPGIHLQALLFEDLDGVAQVDPAARRDELPAFRRFLYEVEAVLVQVQKRGDGIVHARVNCIRAPNGVIRLHVHALDAVERDDVEFVYGAVVFGRVARRDNDPAIGHAVLAEGLELQELQHGRRQRFGHAVDFVQKEYAFGNAGVFHEFVDGGDDL